MLGIDLKKLIKKSLLLTWKNKLLWAFGMFLTSGAIMLDYVVKDWGSLSAFREQFAPRVAVIFSDFGLFFVSLLSILLVGFFLLLAIFAKGSLLYGLSQIKGGTKPQVKSLLSSGKRNFAKLLLIDIMFGLGNLAIFTVLILLLNVKLILALLVVLILLYNLLLFIFKHYIYCFIVLENQKPIQAIMSGWKLFLQNWKKLLMVKLVEVCLWILAIFVVMLCIILISLPFILLGLIAVIVLGIGGLAFISMIAYLILSLAFIFIYGGVRTFFFSYLTNIYWEIKE